MDFCKGKQSGCRCRRCADGSGVPNNDEGLTLKDAAIGVGAAAAAVGAVSLLGWGISMMKTPGRDFQNFGDDFGGDPSSSSSSSSDDDDDDDDDDGKGKKLFATLVAGLLGGTSLGENNRIFMVHCDGSHLPNISGGYGALIRDNDGEVIAAAAGSSEPVNITVHELNNSTYVDKLVLTLDFAI
ncbi:hypothetical protein BVC80_1215g5 [Macleaya cordata]|uniref:Uncharacterized protein n=1 Tax=Macleaya cordata TaxID=56857 RepID=A0A200Q326_MACCD|nr:hypothetical protein BVC80_1215g5 [Macleaya cordata]